MSRIHQILSKADREGTTAGLTWPDPTLRDRDLPPSVAPFRADQAGAAVADEGTLPPDDAPVTGANGVPFAGRPMFGVKLHKQLVAAVDPFSAAAEQYRTLRTRLAQLDTATPRHVLAVTSPCRGDGKTLTVLNLALSMAQEFDRRTLLIDADLRHARLHSLLGISREPGLVDVLSGTAPLEEALVTLPGHRLQVLPAGAAHTQPSELLGSAPMRRLLDGLRRHFDRVVVDTAAAQSADTGALEPCLDGLLVVVRAGRTDRPSIERALTAIPSAKLVGLVLNDIRTDSAPGA
jgi:capsular exopolysaccharide synthesis family protein